VYNHLNRPHQLREGGAGEEFQLFAEGIKPTWEDPANAKGGKLVVRLPPQLTSHYWEALVSRRCRRRCRRRLETFGHVCVVSSHCNRYEMDRSSLLDLWTRGHAPPSNSCWR
jgi:hypothetical protein